MRRSIAISIAALLFSIAGVCAGQTTRATVPEQLTPTELRVLVACLSGDRDETRKDALEKLLAHGEAAETILIEKLPAVRNDADAAGRYQQILSRIDADRRVRTALAPTRVTVHVEKAPARTVFASLYQRAGAPSRVSFAPPYEAAGDQPVTLHVDNVPFWEVVRQLEKQTGLTLTSAGKEAAFAKPPPEQVPGPVAIHGPFMIVARVARGAPKIESIRVFLEPKVRLAWHAARIRVTEARDQFATPLVYPTSLDRSYLQGEVLDVGVPVETGNRRIVYLKGSVTAELIARLETVRSDELQCSIHFNDFGRRFSMRLFRGEAGHLLHLWQPPQWDDERDVAGLRPVLLDANQTPLPPSRRARAGQAWEWTFVPMTAAWGNRVFGEPQTLQMDVPVITREIEIPFEFDIRPVAKR